MPSCWAFDRHDTRLGFVRICLVTPHFPSTEIPGCVDGLFLFREAKLLARHGHEFVVVACQQHGLPKFEIVGGIPVYRVPSFMIPRISYPIPNIFQLVSTILNVTRKHHIELLDFWGQLYLTSLPILVKDIVRLPMSVSIAGLPGVNWFYGGRIINLVGLMHSFSLTTLILKQTNGIRSEHSSLTDFLTRFGVGGKTRTIGRAVDPTLFRQDAKKRMEKRKELSVDENEVVVLFVGRFEIVKGIKYLIQAATELLREYKYLRFIFVGDGFLREEYEGKVGGGQKVMFLGQRSDVNELMNAADIFVLPSLSEGCSAALLEASASSLPVVATRVGGNPEIVLDGRTGICVEPKNVLELTTALRQLIDSPSLRREMGREGRELVEKMFEPVMIAGRVEGYYQSLLRGEH